LYYFFNISGLSGIFAKRASSAPSAQSAPSAPSAPVVSQVHKWQEVHEVHKAPLPLVYPLGTQPPAPALILRQMLKGGPECRSNLGPLASQSFPVKI
jgi:hypothetical protein